MADRYKKTVRSVLYSDIITRSINLFASEHRDLCRHKRKEKEKCYNSRVRKILFPTVLIGETWESLWGITPNRITVFPKTFVMSYRVQFLDGLTHEYWNSGTGSGEGGTNIVPICSLIYCLTQKYEILHHKPTREEEIYKRLIHPWAPVIAVFRPVSLSLGIRAVMSDLRVLRGVRSFHSKTLLREQQPWRRYTLYWVSV